MLWSHWRPNNGAVARTTWSGIRLPCITAVDILLLRASGLSTKAGAANAHKAVHATEAMPTAAAIGRFIGTMPIFAAAAGWQILVLHLAAAIWGNWLGVEIGHQPTATACVALVHVPAGVVGTLRH